MTADTQVPSASTTLAEPRRKFLHSVFTTACEGGIQGWARLRTYRWMKPELQGQPGYPDDCEDTMGFHATIVPADENFWGVFKDPAKDTAELRIDLDVMHNGTVKFVQYCHGILDNQGHPVSPGARKPLRADHYWQQFLEAEKTNGEDGDYDAEVADQIVQWGLFGRGIYG